MSDLSSLAVADGPRRKSASRSARARRQRLPSVAGVHCALLDASIRRISTVLSAPSHQRWAIRTPGMRRITHVDLSAEWLSISMSLRLLSMPINLEVIGSMLNRNARIDGTSRIIGQRQQGRRQIVADIPVEMVPWDCETDLDTLVAETNAGPIDRRNTLAPVISVATNPGWSRRCLIRWRPWSPPPDCLVTLR